MNKYHLLGHFAFLVIIFMATAVVAQDLYKTSAKEMGFSSLDYTVTEIKRTEKLSILHIPGFHKRSSADARWMMCVYTDIAQKRGFQYWAAIYPEPPLEDIIIGFPQTQNENVSNTLGPEFGSKNALPVMPVQKMSVFCDRMKQQK